MDHFDCKTMLRASRNDAVRRWAELEGKSPTMSADLYEQAARPKAPGRSWFARVAFASFKPVAAVFEYWLSSDG